MKLSDLFVPERKRVSPKLHIRKNISPMIFSKGKGTKRVSKAKQLLSDKVNSFI